MTKPQRVSPFRSAIKKIDKEQNSTEDIINPPSNDNITVSEGDNMIPKGSPGENEVPSEKPANNQVPSEKPESNIIFDIFNEKINRFLVSLIKNM